MRLLRDFETESEKQYKAAKIGGYCHLSSGQEAINVGAALALAKEDLLITGYRCHGFALARELSPESVMAELFGRQHGCAGGRGGSMHLLDTKYNFYGGWGIVGGQLPIATGLALGLKQQGKKQAVLCELGEGAVNIGAWHEALNLASLWNLPIVFLVINNKYGMGTDVERASAEPDIHKRASAYKMNSQLVDGNDLQKSFQAVNDLLEEARQGNPAVLEAKTYRFRGHSVADAGLSYRDKEEIEAYQDDDPINKVKEQLLAGGINEKEITAADEKVKEIIQQAVMFADNDSQPDEKQLAHGMYAPGSREQFQRMQPGSPFEDAEKVQRSID